MKIFKYISVFTFVSLIATAGWAQSVTKVGTDAADFLNIPVGARSSGMGGAVTATVNDPSAMYWNPAGLASIKNNDVMVETADWFVDIRHSYLGLVMPLGSGVAGINVTALTMGSIQETTYDNPEGTGRTFNPHSIAVGLSYAQYLLKNFSIGGNVKYISETIMQASAKGIAFDIGTLYTTPFAGIRLGVSVSNVGSKMRMDGDALIVPVDLNKSANGNYVPDAKLYTDQYNLPLRLKVGLAWDAINSKMYRFTLDVDGNSPSDNVQSISVGGELAFLNNTILLRGGLPDLGQRDRYIQYAAGVGINYNLTKSSKISVGYSLESYKYLNNVNRISLQIMF
ncbi:MAG TPA: PorV/PorQ family protein [Balneolales bacterium]|nr:PorV/PorQ family protein [Balneolales bacterium]